MPLHGNYTINVKRKRAKYVILGEKDGRFKRYFKTIWHED